MKKYLIGIFALAIAFVFSAFTTMAPTPPSDLVWFEQEPDQGAIVNASQGIRGDDPPAGLGCNNQDDIPCSVAFSISDGDVTYNPGTGFYSLNAGKTIAGDSDEERFKD